MVLRDCPCTVIEFGHGNAEILDLMIILIGRHAQNNVGLADHLQLKYVGGETLKGV